MAQEKKSRWKVPLGLMATGVAGAAVLVLRGCWHRKMSWPVRYQQHSYQVCLGCGIKRLFDEKAFCAYGPYSYDLNKRPLKFEWKVLRGDALAIEVTPSLNVKCARCWHWRSDVGADAAHPVLCARCVANLFGDGEIRVFA